MQGIFNVTHGFFRYEYRFVQDVYERKNRPVTNRFTRIDIKEKSPSLCLCGCFTNSAAETFPGEMVYWRGEGVGGDRSLGLLSTERRPAFASVTMDISSSGRVSFPNKFRSYRWKIFF